MNHRNRHVSPPRDESGSALILTLWILVTLSLISVGFAHRTRLDLKATGYQVAQLRAHYLAKAAVYRGMIAIQTDDLNRKTAGYDAYNEEWSIHKPFSDEGMFGEEDGAELENETFDYDIIDESGKINVNRATEEMLKSVDGLSLPAARAMLRRRNGFDGVLGTEDDEPFESLAELRSLSEISETAWEGREGGMRESVGLKDILTVYGGDKVNINTASEVVLAAFPDLRRSLADDIAEYRSGRDGELGTKDDRPFKEMKDVSKAGDVELSQQSILSRYGTVNSMAFTVIGTATQNDGNVVARVYATFEKQSQYGTYQLAAWRES